MITGILVSDWTTHLLFAVITSMAGYEYARLTRSARPTLMSILCGVSYLLMAGALPLVWDWVLIGFCAFLLLIPHSSSRGYIGTLGMRLAGIILLPLSFALLKSLVIAGPERMGILIFFIILWIYDSMAYVCGRSFGKHKLWPRVSPGKTWEGFIGGMSFAVLSAYLFYTHYLDQGAVQAIMNGVVISAFGTLGDLFESSLKRQAGVKDSGRIMPGHGGILDRFDGVTLAAPALFCMTQLFF